MAVLGRMRRDDVAEAGGALHLRAAHGRIARDVLTADRTGKFEFAHNTARQVVCLKKPAT
jgi:hypothetical protein